MLLSIGLPTFIQIEQCTAHVILIFQDGHLSVRKILLASGLVTAGTRLKRQNTFAHQILIK